MEIPDVSMDTSKSKCVSTVFMTSRHCNENGMCRNNAARTLSFALKLLCGQVGSTPCEEICCRQKEGCFCNRQGRTPRASSSKRHRGHPTPRGEAHGTGCRNGHPNRETKSLIVFTQHVLEPEEFLSQLVGSPLL